ncbi:MAG: hypothetical protein ED556_13860 [Winogradskyella sp.]|uniref:DUF6686 family protein n=1 Tax=Winogradskyella sp. TaxID=1883156 RepID=UPI000F41CCEF|nr:DUF6686 family protein [Winogradskyella sp.]RNC80186.1 MAG: hypothetical protein ED556_13860 [Winogradskyella sp.]
MPDEIITLARVKSGELNFCTGCKSYHLSFNNLFFSLNAKEFIRLKEYINDIEVDYWEYKYSCTSLKRKIPLPSAQDNLIIMFNRQEIKELMFLLNYTQHKNSFPSFYLETDDIDYEFLIN